MADTKHLVSTRPASVASAVKLLYTTLGVGVLRSAIEFDGLSESVPAEFVITVWLLATTIMLTLFYNIGAGRNWARITFLVLFAIGLPFAVQPLLQSLSSHFVSGVLGIAQLVGQISALVLLFRPDASAWFHRPKKLEKPTESVEF